MHFVIESTFKIWKMNIEHRKLSILERLLPK